MQFTPLLSHLAHHMHLHNTDCQIYNNQPRICSLKPDSNLLTRITDPWSTQPHTGFLGYSSLQPHIIYDAYRYMPNAPGHPSRKSVLSTRSITESLIVASSLDLCSASLAWIFWLYYGRADVRMYVLYWLHNPLHESCLFRNIRLYSGNFGTGTVREREIMKVFSCRKGSLFPSVSFLLLSWLIGGMINPCEGI